MKYLNKLLCFLFVIIFVFSCEERQDNDFTNINSINAIVEDEFRTRLFNLIDSVGYEIDSVKVIDIDNENNLESIKSRLFFGNSENSIFEDKLISSKVFYISQIDSLTPNYRRRTEIFRGTMLLTELTYESIDEIKKMKETYDSKLNFMTNYGVYLSRTIYDCNNCKIWCIIDKSLKSTPQFEELIEVFKIIEHK